jgi:SAM-dependent methyltransferase
MHLNSELLFAKYAKPYFRSGMSVLEIGPNTLPSKYHSVIRNREIKWDTLGLDTSRFKHLTFRSTEEYNYPLADNSYDIVLSGQVLEHVKKIWIWMKELARICKKGGYVITINPVSWEYHEVPVDCWRVYPEGMRALYDDAGLKVLLSKFEGLEDVDHSIDTITIGEKL